MYGHAHERIRLFSYRLLWKRGLRFWKGAFAPSPLIQQVCVNRPTIPNPIVPTWEVVSSKRETTS